MALPNPFRTNRFIIYQDHTTARKVSLAVWLIDEVTGQKPSLDITVSLKGVSQKPVRNPSGYYCFTDLADGEYTLVVRADLARSDWFVAAEEGITLPRPNHLEPVTEIILQPKPSYPFPMHMTLVRGFVINNSGAEPRPLSDVPVYRLFRFTTNLPNNVIPELTIQLQNQEFPPRLREIFQENIFIQLGESITVTPDGDDTWQVEPGEERQICTIELRNGQFVIYYRESERRMGVATQSNHDGEFLLYIKKLEKENNENGMRVFLEAKRKSLRKRKDVLVTSEGITVTEMNFKFLD